MTSIWTWLFIDLALLNRVYARRKSRILAALNLLNRSIGKQTSYFIILFECSVIFFGQYKHYSRLRTFSWIRGNFLTHRADGNARSTIIYNYQLICLLTLSTCRLAKADVTARVQTRRATRRPVSALIARWSHALRCIWALSFLRNSHSCR